MIKTMGHSLWVQMLKVLAFAPLANFSITNHTDSFLLVRIIFWPPCMLKAHDIIYFSWGWAHKGWSSHLFWEWFHYDYADCNLYVPISSLSYRWGWLKWISTQSFSLAVLAYSGQSNQHRLPSPSLLFSFWWYQFDFIFYDFCSLSRS